MGDVVIQVLDAPGQGLCSPSAALQTPFQIPSPQEVFHAYYLGPVLRRAPAPTTAGRS